MTNLKHVGILRNTGDRVIVVFRQLLDEHGNATDTDHALVVYTDRLQDRYHDRMMDLLESDRAQQTENLFEVLNSRTFHDGNNMLSFLHHKGLLKKVLVDNITLCPTPSERIALRNYNESLESDNPEIANRLQQYSDEHKRKHRSEYPQQNEQKRVSSEDIMGQNQPTVETDSDATPEDQAKSLLAQAHVMKQERTMLDNEISKKEKQAYELDPSLMENDSVSANEEAG